MKKFTHKPSGLVFYGNKPWQHQLDAVQFLFSRDAGALYTKPGSGKTRVFLDLINNKGWKNVLILGTKKVCTGGAWEINVAKFTPSIQTINLGNVKGSKKPAVYQNARLEAGNNPLITIINYDSIWREPFKSVVLKTKWDAIVCDESHRIKSPGSKVSKFMARMTTRCPHRYLCTGTPLYSSPVDVYAQYRFCDTRVFGTRLANFRDRYENLNPYATARVGFRVLDKTKPYKNLRELNKKIMSIAYHVDVDLHLPPVVHTDLVYQASETVEKHLKTFRKEHYIKLDEGILTTETALTMYNTEQQLMSGFVKVDGNLVQFEEERFKVLYEFIEDIGRKEPIVVFARYRAEIDKIRKDLKARCLELSGKHDDLATWQRSKNKILVVQPQAGAESVDMTNARYSIYFTQHPSIGLYEQSLKRTHRPGQIKPVTYVHIVARLKSGVSIDEKTKAATELGMDTIDYIMHLQE